VTRAGFVFFWIWKTKTFSTNYERCIGRDTSFASERVNESKTFTRVLHRLSMSCDQEDPNSRWSQIHPCRGQMRAISIWLSYGTKPWSIQNLCIKNSQKILSWKYTLHRVPHILNKDQKVAKVKIAASLLNILEPVTTRAYSWILTGDELCFIFLWLQR
jgi:hypothetical protein